MVSVNQTGVAPSSGRWTHSCYCSSISSLTWRRASSNVSVGFRCCLMYCNIKDKQKLH